MSAATGTAAQPSMAPVPALVSWNVTRRCNLACRHCYLDAVQRRRPLDELSTGDALSVIDQIAALGPGAMLVLTGGEPLLRADLVTLVRHAAARGLAPVIGTNGSLLNARRARALKDAGAAGVGVSLDSPEAAFHDELRGVQGAWRAAMRGAAAACSAGLLLLVQTTLFEQNRSDLAAMADRAEALGAMALNFFFLVCTGRGATQTDLSAAAYEETSIRIVELQRSRRQLVIRARCAPYLHRVMGLHAGEGAEGYGASSSACLAGRGYFRITPQGEVTPCPYIPQIVGDLKAAKLRDIWERHSMLIRLRSALPGGKCGACDFRYSCGGCRARAFARHGDVMAEDPQCAYTTGAGISPEASPAGPERAVTWEPAAQALLERIPAFVRAMVKVRLEQHASSEGARCITVDFMRVHRPRLPFSEWPKSS